MDSTFKKLRAAPRLRPTADYREANIYSRPAPEAEPSKPSSSNPWLRLGEALSGLQPTVNAYLENKATALEEGDLAEAQADYAAGKLAENRGKWGDVVRANPELAKKSPWYREGIRRAYLREKGREYDSSLRQAWEADGEIKNTDDPEAMSEWVQEFRSNWFQENIGMDGANPDELMQSFIPAMGQAEESLRGIHDKHRTKQIITQRKRGLADDIIGHGKRIKESLEGHDPVLSEANRQNMALWVAERIEEAYQDGMSYSEANDVVRASLQILAKEWEDEDFINVLDHIETSKGSFLGDTALGAKVKAETQAYLTSQERQRINFEQAQEDREKRARASEIKGNTLLDIINSGGNADISAAFNELNEIGRGDQIAALYNFNEAVKRDETLTEVNQGELTKTLMKYARGEATIDDLADGVGVYWNLSDVKSYITEYINDGEQKENRFQGLASKEAAHFATLVRTGGGTSRITGQEFAVEGVESEQEFLMLASQRLRELGPDATTADAYGVLNNITAELSNKTRYKSVIGNPVKTPAQIEAEERAVREARAASYSANPVSPEQARILKAVTPEGEPTPMLLGSDPIQVQELYEAFDASGGTKGRIVQLAQSLGVDPVEFAKEQAHYYGMGDVVFDFEEDQGQEEDSMGWGTKTLIIGGALFGSTKAMKALKGMRKGAAKSADEIVEGAAKGADEGSESAAKGADEGSESAAKGATDEVAEEAPRGFDIPEEELRMLDQAPPYLRRMMPEEDLDALQEVLIRQGDESLDRAVTDSELDNMKRYFQFQKAFTRWADFKTDMYTKITRKALPEGENVQLQMLPSGQGFGLIPDSMVWKRSAQGEGKSGSTKALSEGFNVKRLPEGQGFELVPENVSKANLMILRKALPEGRAMLRELPSGQGFELIPERAVRRGPRGIQQKALMSGEVWYNVKALPEGRGFQIVPEWGRMDKSDLTVSTHASPHGAAMKAGTDGSVFYADPELSEAWGTMLNWMSNVAPKQRTRAAFKREYPEYGNLIEKHLRKLRR